MNSQIKACHLLYVLEFHYYFSFPSSDPLYERRLNEVLFVLLRNLIKKKKKKLTEVLSVFCAFSSTLNSHCC